MTNQIATLEHAKEKLVDLGLQFGPKLLAAFLIMVVGFFVARWMGDMFQRWISKLELEPPVRQLLLRVVRVVIFLCFGIMALQQLGFELMPLIAGLGVAGAGIAFAMQGVLGNLFAGLTIIFTKPFRFGEYIEIVGVHGQVTNIALFSTTLLHPDQSRVVIPNRKIIGEILHNYGQIRQLDLTVGVAYGSNLTNAINVVREVLSQNARVLKEPVPVVGVTMLADSSINIAVKPWTSVGDYATATAEIYQAIVEQFRAHNVAIPFPQREVRMLGDKGS